MSKTKAKIIDLIITGILYETDGIILRMKKRNNNGFVYVAQISNELKDEIKRKLS